MTPTTRLNHVRPRSAISRGVASLLAAMSLFSLGAAAQDDSARAQAHWPQFRGVDGNGTSPTARPPIRWSESENVRWKVRIPGSGHSSPVVWQDRIFLLTAVSETEADGSADDATRRPGRPDPQGRGGGRQRPTAPTQPLKYTVVCLDRDNGQIVWQTVVREAVPHEAGHATNSHASASPVTDGKHVYAFFGSQGLYCLDMEGQIVWQRQFGKMQTRNAFGEGSSPALYRDKLVITWDHEGPSYIEALDATTGETLWKVDRDEPSTWATPHIVEHQGTVQVITSGTNRVRSYDLTDGRLIWECGGQASNPIPTPIRGDDMVYCMTGYRGFAIQAIRLDSQGDLTETDQIAWSRNDAAPYVPSAVLYKGQLYYTKSREGVLYSADAQSGELVFGPERLEGIQTVYSSLVAADDKIYVSSREGVTVVLQHGPEFKVLAVNRLDESIDATAALVDDQILIRGRRHLYCIGE
jgi:outer membrane protein assembly factor BamB